MTKPSTSAQSAPKKLLTGDSEALATPEGDNEDLPSEALSPDEPTPLRPPGDQPHSIEPLRKALDTRDA